MKRFLLNAFLFICILLVFNLLFNYIIWLKYFKNYEAVNLDYSTYLLADSHGEKLGNVLERKGTYNFSASSDSYFDMLRKTRYLLEHSNLKKLYITCDDHVISKYREKSNNLDRSAQFSDYKEFDSYFEYIKAKYLSRYIVFFNSKANSLLKAYFKSYLFTTIKTKPSVKSEWNDFGKEDRLSKAKKRAKTQFPDTVTSDTLTHTLQEILTLCKKHGIEVVGVKFPLSSDYYYLIKPLIENQPKSAESVFLKNKLKVLNYTTIFLDNNEFFSDQDHLNDLGSKAFFNNFPNKDTLIHNKEIVKVAL